MHTRKANQFLGIVLTYTVVVTIGLCASDDTNDNNVFLKDIYGNVVFNNRTAKYVRPIPVGNGTYKTNLEYDAKGLDALYRSARTFLQDVQPNSFPFDILEKAANGDFDFATDSQELIKHFYGLTTCFVIGVVAVAVFAISGLCFCCCRGFCGNCGGDETQTFSNNEGCRRMGLTQALILMLLCVASAAVCIYITNERFTDAVEFTNDTVSSNLDDMDLYLKNTAAQFRYTVTDMYEIIHQALIMDIDDIGNFTASSIADDLKITEMEADLYMLDQYVRNLSISLGQTQLDISELQDAESDLIRRLGVLADDISTTQTSCSGSCSPNICFDIRSDDVRHGSSNTTRELQNMNETQSKVDAINSTEFSEIARQAVKDLERVADNIDSLSGDMKEAVRKTLNDYKALINSLTSGVFKTMAEAFPAEDLKEQTHDIFDTVEKYDKYRRWFGFALTTLFVIITALMFLGILLGIVWDDVMSLPTERNSVSNLGGNILLFAVAVLFLAGALLTLLAAVTFLFGGLLEKSCEPIEDLTLFRDFLDQGKVPSFSTSNALLGVKTVQLSAYDVLMFCRANKTPWVAFKMGEVVPLEQYIQYIKYLGGIGQTLQDLGSIDISAYKVLSNRMSTAMSELQDTGIDSIDFPLINTIIELPTLLFNVPETTAAMQNIASNCNSPVKERWRTHAEDLQTIQDTNVADVDKKKIQLGVSASLTHSNVEHVQNLTNNILQIARAADEKLIKNTTGVLLQASVVLFGKILSLVDSYATEVTYMIYNDLANCIPLWNLYKSFTVVLCDYGVDTLNGYWFSIGWGVLFFCPMIIVATKLSKHYKIMSAAVGYERSFEFPGHPKAPGPVELPDVTDRYESSKL